MRHFTVLHTCTLNFSLFINRSKTKLALKSSEQFWKRATVSALESMSKNTLQEVPRVLVVEMKGRSMSTRSYSLSRTGNAVALRYVDVVKRFQNAGGCRHRHEQTDIAYLPTRFCLAPIRGAHTNPQSANHPTCISEPLSNISEEFQASFNRISKTSEGR